MRSSLMLIGACDDCLSSLQRSWNQEKSPASVQKAGD